MGTALYITSLVRLETYFTDHDSAAQVMQAATFDAVEYVPLAHGVHVVAPAAVLVLVIEPAGQSMQSEASSEPRVPTYLPAVQAMQPVDAVEPFVSTYLPRLLT